MSSVLGVSTFYDVFSLLNNAWSNVSLSSWTNSSYIYRGYWGALSSYTLGVEHTLVDGVTIRAVNLLFIYQLILNNIFILVLSFIFIVYLANQGLQFVGFTLSGADIFSSVYAYLSDADDEVGALDDVLVYGLLFAVIVAWYFFFTLFVTYYINNLTWFLVLMNFIFLTAAMLPLFVLYSFGAAFPTYVRGVGKSTSLMMEAFLDVIAIGVMFSRFLIQNFRLALVFGAFFELSEFIYMTCDFSGVSLFDKLLSLNVTRGYHYAYIYWYDWFSDFLITQLLLIYYWGHLLIVFIGQLINYFLLSFYLFYFLYTTFTLEVSEKYFFYKRSLGV